MRQRWIAFVLMTLPLLVAVGLPGCGGNDGPDRGPSLTPSSHREQLERADRRWAMGDAAAARDILREVSGKDAAAFGAVYRLGVLYLSDDPDSALVYFDRAAALAPMHPGPVAFRGLAYMLQSRFAKMNEAFDRARELSRLRYSGAVADSAHALFQRADRTAAAGDAATARELLTQALALDADYAPAHYGLGRMDLDDSAYRSAALRFFTASLLDPTVPEHLLNTGQTLMRMSFREAGAEFIRYSTTISAGAFRPPSTPPEE